MRALGSLGLLQDQNQDEEQKQWPCNNEILEISVTFFQAHWATLISPHSWLVRVCYANANNGVVETGVGPLFVEYAYWIPGLDCVAWRIKELLGGSGFAEHEKTIRDSCFKFQVLVNLQKGVSV